MSVSPTRDFVANCRDKRRTAIAFDGLGVSPLREVASEFPRFVKPISGSLSADIHVVLDPAGLHPRLEDRARFVHQELIDRNVYDEFTVDMLYSGQGTWCAPCRGDAWRCAGARSPRAEQRRVRSSRRFVARWHTSQEPAAASPCSCSTGPRELDRPVIGIEINARFGGGYPMSHAAGATFAEWLVNEHLLGETLHYRDDWQDGLTFLRYDEQVAVGD